MLRALCNGNRAVCMHFPNPIEITFVLEIFSLYSTFLLENSNFFVICVRNTSCIFACIVVNNLLAFIIGDNFPIDCFLYVEKHVSPKH